jgi:UPF0042 nucleotide-binding protein
MEHETTNPRKPVVLLAGYRYSGRSLALQRLEAAGYTCVDNLPAALVPDYLDHGAVRGEAGRTAIAVDTAGNGGGAALEALLDRLEGDGTDFRFVFIEAGDSALAERAAAAEDAPPPRAGSFDRERAVLAAAKRRAHLVLDSSYASPVEIRDRIIALAEGKVREVVPVVDILSFGFKYGAPAGDLVLDVRFIPNPYYIAALRPLNGKDERCADYVLSQESARGSLLALATLVKAMVPAYADQGRASVKVRIGCTGGQHRSVAMAEALSDSLSEAGIPVRLRHREMEAKRY